MKKSCDSQNIKSFGTNSECFGIVLFLDIIAINIFCQNYFDVIVNYFDVIVNIRHNLHKINCQK